VINLSAFIRFHARLRPDSPALIYRQQRIGYAELAARIDAVAGLLAAEGIAPGDVVAAVMKNSAAFLEIAFAVSHVGAVFLPINYRLAAPEVAYIAGNAGAKLAFVDDELRALAPDVARLVAVDDAAQSDSRRLAPRALPVPPPARLTPDDLFRLMYTSGTTDRPKGVMHSYANFYWKSMDHVVALGLSAADRLLVVGPLYHVGAFDLPGVAVLWVGGTLCVLREFDAEEALAAIERDRLTCAWMAPVMLGHVLAAGERARRDVSSLTWCIGGAEKTPEARIRAFSARFPNGRYIDAYGLTESCGGDTFMEPGFELAKIGSTGRAVAHVEIEIRDDAGTTLGPGRDGEICLRGPKITKGYWKDPEKTRASFFGDWFRTGDIGRLDADGFLYVTDRKKDMINSGGENIASSEVERVIHQLPQVSEAAVIGVPDDKWGERPIAVVVLRDGAALDFATLDAHCRAQLAGFKTPKALHVRTSLPRNPSGKILKRILRAEFRR
jgi:acyl-CoA synthetase (AMP-forming)/AMP-acid ligase II